jgi:hypothetical protein
VADSMPGNVKYREFSWMFSPSVTIMSYYCYFNMLFCGRIAYLEKNAQTINPCFVRAQHKALSGGPENICQGTPWWSITLWSSVTSIFLALTYSSVKQMELQWLKKFSA